MPGLGVHAVRPACRPLPRACWSLPSPGVLAALAASPEDTIQGPDAPAPAQSQWDRRGPDRRPVAPGPRADRLEALHPFLFSEAPTCPPNRQGRGGGIGGAGRCTLPPHPLQGDSHSFPLTAPPSREILLWCPARGSPLRQPPDLSVVPFKTETPLPSPPPFRCTATRPIFYLATRGVFSAGEERGAAGGGPGSLKAGGPAGGGAARER